jgi:hypothetical protein
MAAIDRVFEFSFNDGSVKVGKGRDRSDAFQKLGLTAADAEKLSLTRDITPRRRQPAALKAKKA